jgi:hypothetical protein
MTSFLDGFFSSNLTDYLLITACGGSKGIGFNGPASYFFNCNLLVLGENF